LELVNSQQNQQKDRNIFICFITHVLFAFLHHCPSQIVPLYSLLSEFPGNEIVEKFLFYLENKVLLFKQTQTQTQITRETREININKNTKINIPVIDESKLIELCNSANENKQNWYLIVEPFLLLNCVGSIFETQIVKEHLTHVKTSPLISSLFENVSFSVLLTHICLMTSSPTNNETRILTEKIRTIREYEDQIIVDSVMHNLINQILFEVRFFFFCSFL
jgi:hypothetical protein